VAEQASRLALSQPNTPYGQRKTFILLFVVFDGPFGRQIFGEQNAHLTFGMAVCQLQQVAVTSQTGPNYLNAQ